jgi:hypothetical protein
MLDKLRALLEGAPGKEEEPFSQPKDARSLVRSRRLKRRLKAAASLSLALGAGLFISCQRLLGADEEEEEPQKGAPASSQEAKPPASEASSAPVSSPSSTPATSPSSELVPASQSSATSPASTRSEDRKGKVSIKKHRKGMPVPDNLLE